jgi:sterol desaturase/sphingolipid hydroxylase (fatty acid hydroxylase superfamily)
LSLQAGLLVAVALESLFPRRPFSTPGLARWGQNLTLLMLGSLLPRLCIPLGTVSLALLARQNHWGLFHLAALPYPASLLIGVVALDGSLYALHRLFHVIPLLWRFHQVHHSDLDVDCSTTIRHHPGEELIAQAFLLCVIVALGVEPSAVSLWLAIQIMVDILNHSNLALPEPVDRQLRWLLVSPDMHRIHHSANATESNRNFGNVLPWWDHLFSTYLRAPEGGQIQMNLGLAHLQSSAELSLGKLLLLPFSAPVAAQGGEPSRQRIAG